MTLYGLSLIPLGKCPQLIHRPGFFCFLPWLKEILLNPFTATAGVTPEGWRHRKGLYFNGCQCQDSSFLSRLELSPEWIYEWIKWIGKISPNNRTQFLFFFFFSTRTILSWAKGHLNWRKSWHSALKSLVPFFLQYFLKRFPFIWDLFKRAVIILLKIMVTGSDD